MALPTADQQLQPYLQYVSSAYQAAKRSIPHTLLFSHKMRCSSSPFFLFLAKCCSFYYYFQYCFFIFFFQAFESSGSAAMLSHAMLHFEAAVWHSPVHNNRDAFEVPLPVLSSLVPFAHDIPSKFLPFCCLAYDVNFGLLPFYGNFMVTSYSIYGAFSRKFSRIFRLLCYSSWISQYCGKKKPHTEFLPHAAVYCTGQAGFVSYFSSVQNDLTLLRTGHLSVGI